ncbi:flagellar associated protein [Babesia caballi]|uniref:Flagellar associated protein n=1 Tax=Babesia caballi TaxID=5871 RepID=A0AAV4LVS2_BABCB|nr:flagellar associated protein [Babesia caballi]
MGCPIQIPTPTTLKEVLELFDVMHKSFGGAKQGVKKALEQTRRYKDPAEFNDLTLALTNASELRARIVGYHKVKKYGKYNSLENSGNDETCGYIIISILKQLLPKLIETLEFLLKKVESIGKNHWGGQRCDGGSISFSYTIPGSGGGELRNWLIDKSYSGNYFCGGYERRELSSNTGDTLKAFLEKLVKRGQNSLGNLHASIKDIATYGIQVNSSPSPPSPDASPHGASGGSGGYGSYGLNYQPSESTASRERPSTPPPHPPTQTSPTLGGPYTHTDDNGDSGASRESYKSVSEPQSGATASTATIGGAVGATGLVGGGAAVYFLNVGGIRTLIAG